MYQKLKSKAFIISLIMILFVSVGTTMAYLIDSTDPVTNKFIPSTISVMVEENIDGSVKNNVTLRNTGNTKAFVRAAVVVTWQSEDGKVSGQMPIEGTDYVLDWKDQTHLNGSNWKKGTDDFYYYLKALEGDPDGTGEKKGGSTTVLFTKCQIKDGATVPDGYSLNVEIIGSAIQAAPDNAVEEAWSNSKVKVDANNGTLEISPLEEGNSV